MTISAHGWIDVSEPDETLVLRIGGELDTGSRKSIEPAITAAIMAADSVVLDLAELTFCDSNGIAMFIAMYEKSQSEDTVLLVRNVQPQVRRVFEITCTDVMLGLADHG
jgi:anti-sigma B factor antagonist